MFYGVYIWLPYPQITSFYFFIVSISCSYTQTLKMLDLFKLVNLLANTFSHVLKTLFQIILLLIKRDYQFSRCTMLRKMKYFVDSFAVGFLFVKFWNLTCYEFFETDHGMFVMIHINADGTSETGFFTKHANHLQIFVFVKRTGLIQTHENINSRQIQQAKTLSYRIQKILFYLLILHQAQNNYQSLIIIIKQLGQVQQSIVFRKTTYKVQIMIPGKIFLESISYSEQLSSKSKFHLIMNGLFYDELKLFQNKYICLTANDLLTIELVLLKNIKSSKSQSMSLAEAQMEYESFAAVPIVNGYKLILETKTIQICYKLDHLSQSIRINLVFQPVASFNRKKLGVLGTTNRINNIFNQSSPTSKDKTDNLYSHLNNSRNGLKQSCQKPLALGQSNYLRNSSRWSKFDHNLIHEQNSSQQNYKSAVQGQSLQSLAYQRQRILGQLFGKFKK